MPARLSIGEFSRMTHLSVKALRHYHEEGLLEPARIDPSSGYRFYAPEQVATAHVIRRLRDLDMPVDQVRAVLRAPDLGARNREIAAHLSRMERQLEETRATVASLRSLLQDPPPRPSVAFRAIPATSTLAVRSRVGMADFMPWWVSVFEELRAALDEQGARPAGPGGALYPPELFEVEEADVTAFVPVAAPASPRGRAEPLEIPAVEAAIMVHEGPAEESDRTYGALGTVVAERAIGLEGPIREYYLVGPWDTDDEHRLRTEVCWPIFRTAGEPT